MGKLLELVLLAGPILAFAIYELYKLKKEAKASKSQPPRDGKA